VTDTHPTPTARRIELVERVLEANDTIAAATRIDLERRGILSIDLIGAPGSGKTALLEATLRELRGRAGGIRPAVLVGDLTTQRDGDRLARWCDQVVQISTGQGCHLEAGEVRAALSELTLDGVGLLLVENVGNLICPVGFDLGLGATVGLFSVTEGDDKAAKHPYLVEEAHLLLLNKVDLLPFVSFDLEAFRADVRRIDPSVPILEVSATTGQGIGDWLAWLDARATALRG
jgi:hydrogenase nickel incorporation protein HypB